MKVGTFFSGVGSPEQALKNLGVKHEIEFACDIDNYAKQTYLKNFKPKLFAEDITAIDMQNLPYVDLLVFGFPCQAFSMAGKRKGFDDTRGTLFYDALRYLKEHKPRYFIAENVKGLLSHDNGKTFGTIINCLAKTTNYQMSLMPFENLGYHIHYKVLNTKDFGLPQNRERIFIIGIRDDEDNNFNFPKEIPLKLKLKDILQDNPNSKYYLNDKKKEQLEKHKEKQLAKGNGFHYTINDGNKNAYTLTTGEGSIPTSNWILVDEKYYLTEEQQKRLLDITEVEVEWIADYRTDEGLRIRKDNISPCINSHLKGGEFNEKRGQQDLLVGNQKKIRRLTPIECERLQGFPDNFTEGVSDTQRYKQMGNTITVNVIQAIIKNLINV